jgi:hypothetical protein
MMQTSFVVTRRASSVSPIMCASTTKKSSSFADRFKSNKTVKKSSKLFNDFHKQRSETIKGNVNQLNVISQKDMNEVNAFLKDLDLFHREQFEELKASFRKRTDSDETEKTETDTEDNDNEGESDSESESIFLKKQ